MGNTDSSVLLLEQLSKSLVNQGLGFGVQRAGGFVKNEDVGVLDEGAGNGYALLLSAGELCTAGADVGFETIRL